MAQSQPTLTGKIYPFKFLDSYTERDTQFFFGRDEEIKALYEMIFQTNILLVYGGSGTGKTSLIRCGLAGKFKPHDWQALYIRRGANLNESFNKALEEAGGETDSLDLESSFKQIYRNSFRPLYLIFDQFEELFIINPDKNEQNKFIDTVKAILKVEQPVKMIFSIREEYLGFLYDFEKEVPQIMRRKLRIEQMNLGKVTDVIKGLNTVANSLVRIKESDENAIASAIFEKIRDAKHPGTIQLPYLQLFLDKLYLETTHDKTRKTEALFTKEIVASMAPIDDVLLDFLEEQVAAISKQFSTAERPLALDDVWDLLSPFATLEGTKRPISIAMLTAELADAKIDPLIITPVVAAFETGRILRKNEGDTYELVHDILAKKVAGKRSEEEVALLEVEKLIKSQMAMKEADRELFTPKQIGLIDLYKKSLLPRLNEDDRAFIVKSRSAITAREVKRKKERRIQFAAMGVVAIVMFILGVWALFNSIDARRKTRTAQSLALSSQAVTEINKNNNYTRAFRFAQYAFEKDSGNLNAMQALYNIVFQPGDKPAKLFYLDALPHQPGDTTFIVSGDGAKVLYFENEKTVNVVDVNDYKKIITIPYDSIKAILAKRAYGSDGRRGIQLSLSRSGSILMAREEYGGKGTFFIDVRTGKKMTYRPATQSVSVYFAPNDQQILLPMVDSSFRTDSAWHVSNYDSDWGAFTYAVTRFDVFDKDRGVLADSIILPKASRVNSVIFSGDGSRSMIYSTNRTDNCLQVYSTKPWRKLKELHTNKNDSLYFSFSKDHQYIAAKCGRNAVAYFDAATMSTVKADTGLAGRFTFNCQRLVYNSDRTSLSIFNFIDGTSVAIMHNANLPADEELNVVFRLGKTILASDQTVVLSEIYVGRPNFDGFNVRREIGNSRQTKICSWNAVTGRLIVEAPLKWVNKGVINHAFSPDRKLFLSTTNESATLWNMQGEQVAVLGGLSNPIQKALFSRDSKYLLTFSADGFVKKWNMADIGEIPYSPASNILTSFSDVPIHSFSRDVHGMDQEERQYLKMRQPVEIDLPGGRKLLSSNFELRIQNKPAGLDVADHLPDSSTCLYSINSSDDGNYFVENFVHIPDGKFMTGINTDRIRTTFALEHYSVFRDITSGRKVIIDEGLASRHPRSGSIHFHFPDVLFSPDSKFLFYKGGVFDTKTFTELLRMDVSQFNDGVFFFSKDSRMFMQKKVNTRYRNEKDGTISDFPGDGGVPVADSTLKTWLIDARAIIHRFDSELPDISPEEKMKYGIPVKGKHN